MRQKIAINTLVTRLVLSVALTFALAGQALAQKTYKTTDADGNVTYSDVPGKDSIEVDSIPKNVMEIAPTNQESPTKLEIVPVKEKNTAYRLTVNSPGENEKFGLGQRTLTISASVSPELDDKHYLAYYFDGSQIGEATKESSASVPLGLKLRGQRFAQVKVVDESGNVLTQSPSIKIYVIR